MTDRETVGPEAYDAFEPSLRESGPAFLLTVYD